MIVFIVDQSVICQKPKSESTTWRPKMSWFVQKPKDIQVTVTEEQKTQKIFTFKKLESRVTADLNASWLYGW